MTLSVALRLAETSVSRPRCQMCLTVDHEVAHAILDSCAPDTLWDGPVHVSKVQLVNPPETARSYSSVYWDDLPGTGHARSMLGSPQAWSPTSSKPGEWMQIDLECVQSVVGIVTQGRADDQSNQYVSSLKVQLSRDGVTFSDVPGVFSSAQYPTKTESRFPAPQSARYVRLVPQSSTFPSMQAAVLVNLKPTVSQLQALRPRFP